MSLRPFSGRGSNLRKMYNGSLLDTVMPVLRLRVPTKVGTRNDELVYRRVLETMEDLKQKLKEALSLRQKTEITDASRASAAVLVPVFLREGEYYIVFTRRTQTVKYHKGEISFPGGAYHPGDKSLLETALRESAEEIGLAADDVEMLGELDDVSTRTSSYIVSPFVALIPHSYRYRLSPEEAEQIIEVPVSALMDIRCLREEPDVIDSQKVTHYSYHYKGMVIHGATARILHQFLDIMAKVMGSQQCKDSKA